MRIVRDRSELLHLMNELRKENPGQLVGFVPTMGYLHSGHSTLIDHARKTSDFVIVSIFVNPTQFGPGEDFDRYPRDEQRDLKLCLSHGVDLVFLPDCEQMYSNLHATYIQVRGISNVLCGAFRPGHFDGVATIVGKLFNLIQPDMAYFGQKDGQQIAIIKKMTRDLDFKTHIVVVPTVREPDGLAMSSRNVYLSSDARKIAPVVFKSLCEAKKRFDDHSIRSAETLISTVKERLSSAGEIEIQYVEIRTTEDLQPVETITEPVLLAVAVILDRVRLIDNVILNPREDEHDPSR